MKIVAIATLVSMVALAAAAIPPIPKTKTIVHESETGVGEMLLSQQNFKITGRTAFLKEDLASPPPSKSSNLKQRDLQRRLAGNPVNMLDSDRIAILNKHNGIRSATALGNVPNQPATAYMETLFWDPALEAVATSFVQTCSWGSNANRQSDYAIQPNPAILYSDEAIGQNSYFLYGGSSPPTGDLSVLLGAIDSWSSKNASYNFDNDTCSGTNCGLWKQLVRNDTRYIGCAYNICPVLTSSTSGQTWNDATLFVCHYLLAGNYPGQPYVAGTGNCTGCPLDTGSQCSDGLCSGCPSFAHYKCNTDVYINCADFLTNVCPSCDTATPVDTNICDGCPKTCNFCNESASQQTSPSFCPPLDPTAASRNETTSPPTTSRPTSSPTTSAPTGPVTPCTGYTITMELSFNPNNANCAQYSAALQAFKPCIPNVSQCEILPAFVRFVFTGDLNLITSFNGDVWRAGIESELADMGVQFN